MLAPAAMVDRVYHGVCVERDLACWLNALAGVRKLFLFWREGVNLLIVSRSIHRIQIAVDGGGTG